MSNTENIGYFFADFLPSKELLFIIEKATKDVRQLNVPAIKTSLEIFFGHYSTIQITV